MSSLPTSMRNALPTSPLAPLSPGKERHPYRGFPHLSMAGPAKGFARLIPRLSSIDSPTLFAGALAAPATAFQVGPRALRTRIPRLV